MGWGKQLTYVIASSNKEIVDVTNRYVVDPLLNKMRRKEVNEKWLSINLKNRRDKLWDMQGEEMKKILFERFCREQEELTG
jgi:hypothetical protein